VPVQEIRHYVNQSTPYVLPLSLSLSPPTSRLLLLVCLSKHSIPIASKLLNPIIDKNERMTKGVAEGWEGRPPFFRNAISHYFTI